MNVLSLFDGISCGQQALKELGVPVEKYYASEIDKYAISITQHNFPDTIQLGDIEEWREWELCNHCGEEYQREEIKNYEYFCDNCEQYTEPIVDWQSIDLIQGGSPCQGFSFAGKQLNFEDPRSKLFFTFVDILNHARKYNPDVKFLLENVRMKQEYQDIISEALGVKPVMINSALVSAQNRVRLYWTNIGEIEQPQDRGILLKDILEDVQVSDISEKRHTIIEKNLGSRIKKDTLVIGSSQKNAMVGKDKCSTITQAMAQGGGQIPMTRCVQVGEANLKGHDSIKRVYSPEGKSPTLTAAMGMGGNQEKKVETTADDPRADRRGGHREPKVEVRDKSKTVRSSGRGSYDRHEWDSVGKLTPSALTMQALRCIIELYLYNLIHYAKQKANTNKVLQELWKINDKKAMEKQIGDIVSLYSESVLRQELYGTVLDKSRKQVGKMVSTAQQGTATKTEREMRNLWERECERCASQGWRPHKQSYQQFTKSVQKLPYYSPQNQKSMQNLWKQTQGVGVLREALPAFQEIWKSIYDEVGNKGLIWRKLSVTECEALQTLPRDYTAKGTNEKGEEVKISNTQRYKALGNGWTVEVIKHIYKNLL